ncbi:MAG: hypothetical protein HKL80_02245 [Acidimicrobiales bacterium]|nr:hypothetical protein [Acidimicrobiales bacterium]
MIDNQISVENGVERQDKKTSTRRRQYRLFGIILAITLVPLVTALISNLNFGWMPLGDNAAISWRAMEVFTSHPPLLGQLTLATTNNTLVFDLGPLEYFMLSPFILVFGTNGGLIGAFFWATLSTSISIFIAWKLFGKAGLIGAGISLSLLFIMLPPIVLNSIWNPYFGLFFFALCILSSVAAALEASPWFIVSIFSGSIAMQSHLIYFLPVLFVVASTFGLLLYRDKSFRRSNWIQQGLIPAGICWVLPLFQQFFGAGGNLSNLVGSLKGQSTFGMVNAIKMGSYLLVSPPEFHAGGPFLFNPSSMGGADVIIAFILLVALFSASMILRSKFGNWLVFLNVALWISFFSAVFEISKVSANLELSFTYEANIFIVLKLLFWAILIFTLGIVLLDKMSDILPRFVKKFKIFIISASFLVLLVLSTVSAVAVSEGGINNAELSSDYQQMPQLRYATDDVLANYHPQSVQVDINFVDGNDLSMDFGLAYALNTHGWHATVPGIFGQSIGSSAKYKTGTPDLFITDSSSSISICILKAESNSGQFLRPGNCKNYKL